MRGLLFYDKVGAKRNEWFINRLCEVAKEYGCEIQLVVSECVEEAISHCSFLPDFAIVRTISPLLNERLEALGIPVFNNAKTSRIANDKWQTYLYLKALGVSVMETELIDEAAAEKIEKSNPRVIKSVDGHGGSEVFLVKNAQECKEILSTNKGKRFISQQLCDEPGVDMRVYTLGGEVLMSVCRSSDKDFRSNFSLGGKAQITELCEKEMRTVRLVADDLGADLIGIDFIRHKGEWVLNEIEDVVGTRMLYSLTDIDAAEVYVKYILNKVRKTTQIGFNV